MNRLEEIRKEAEAKYHRNDQIIADYQKKIDVARQESETQAEIINSAFKARDVKKYTKASEVKRQADDQILMFTNAIREVESEKTFTKEDYQSALSAVYDELNRTVSDSRKKMRDLVNQIIEEADKTNAFINAGNALLQRLQNDFYQDEEAYYVSNGRRIVNEAAQQRFNDWSLSIFANSVQYYANVNGIIEG